MNSETREIMSKVKANKLIPKTRQKRIMEQLRKEKIRSLFEEKRDAMLARRLASLSMTEAHRCAIIGDEYRLRQEIEIGHNVNERSTARGRSILHEAVTEGHLHIVRMLCGEYKANLNLPTFLGGETPLHLAVFGNYRQIASMLITYGANLNQQDKKGCSPLHFVTTIPVLKLLFKFNVDPCLKNNAGETPYTYYMNTVPAEKRNEEIMTLMRSKEDMRSIENARAKIAADKAMREEYLLKQALVNGDNSTIASK